MGTKTETELVILEELPNDEYASYLTMVAYDLEESGMEATATDYHEAARRLRLCPST